MNESKWGQYYWGVSVPRAISKSGYIYLNADSVRIEHGALIFQRDDVSGIDAKDTEALKGYRGAYVGATYIFAPGQWQRFFAASVFSGAPVAVDNYGHSGDDDESAQNSQKQRGKMDQSLRYKILKRDQFKCVSCGRSPTLDGVSLEVDHIQAIANGGLTTEDNLQVLCKDCNRSKGIGA